MTRPQSSQSLAGLMNRLQIAATLTLPLDAATKTFAVLAARGPRRTHAATVLVEEMVSENLPVVIVDSVGVWHGLRSSADGKTTGLPVHLLGGKRGELSFRECAGERVADLVTELRRAVVLDLSQFSRAAAQQFVDDLARRLLRRNRDVLHVVVDEADVLLPRHTDPGSDDLTKLLRCGRDVGIGVTLVSRQPALLSERALVETEVLIAARTTAREDRAAIERWIERRGNLDEGAPLIESLASLSDDEAWVWSRDWLKALIRVRIRPRATADGLRAARVGELRPPQSQVAASELRRLRTKVEAHGEDDRGGGDGIPATQKRRRGRPVESLVLTVEERVRLQRYTQDQTIPPVLAQRARIVLACAEGRLNGDVARALKTTNQAVGRWRRRFVEYGLDGLLCSLGLLGEEARRSHRNPNTARV